MNPAVPNPESFSSGYGLHGLPESPILPVDQGITPPPVGKPEVAREPEVIPPPAGRVAGRAVVGTAMGERHQPSTDSTAQPASYPNGESVPATDQVGTSPSGEPRTVPDVLPPISLARRVENERRTNVYHVPKARADQLMDTPEALEFAVVPYGNLHGPLPMVKVNLSDPVTGRQVAYGEVRYHVYRDAELEPESRGQTPDDPVLALGGDFIERGVMTPPDELSLDTLRVPGNESWQKPDYPAIQAQAEQAVGVLLDGYVADAAERTTYPVFGVPGELVSRLHRDTLGITTPMSQQEFADLVIGGPGGLNRVVISDFTTLDQLHDLSATYGDAIPTELLATLPVVAGTVSALEKRGCTTALRVANPVGATAALVVDVGFTRADVEVGDPVHRAERAELNDTYRGIL